MIRTAFTRKFPCSVPVCLPPMAGVGGGELAAAVARAGGLPFIPVGHGNDLDQLDKQIRLYRDQAVHGSPLCLGFISWSALGINDCLEEVLVRFRPDVLQFFAPAIPSENAIQACKDAEALVVAQVGTLRGVKEARAAGVDAIMVQGVEAGGHGLRPELGRGTLALAAAAAQHVKVDTPEGPQPILLAAGGIASGRGLAAALALGCDGAVVGTRFAACKEALGDPRVRKALLDTSGDETIRTQVFDKILGVIRAPYDWPEPYDTVGAAHNVLSRTWDSNIEELKVALGGKEPIESYKKALKEGDTSILQCLMGEGVDFIKSVDHAEDVLKNIEMEAAECIRELSSMIQTDV